MNEYHVTSARTGASFDERRLVARPDWQKSAIRPGPTGRRKPVIAQGIAWTSPRFELAKES